MGTHRSARVGGEDAPAARDTSVVVLEAL